MDVLDLTLKQDIGKGDITSKYVLPKGAKAKAKIVSHGSGIVAGVKEARKIFKGLKFTAKKRDGERIRSGTVVIEVEGSARKILERERGGGWAHRKGLWDFILIKDNHLKLLNNDIESAIQSAKNARETVEVETTNEKDAIRAALAGADIIMLDNFTPAKAKKAIREIRKVKSRVMIELSGGITPKNIKNYAKLGADIVSMGYLTQSCVPVDFSLDVTKK